jgi:hypothetical protein
MPGQYRRGKCIRCGTVTKLVGRQLDKKCAEWAKKNGRLEDYPRVTVPLALIVEEVRHPARVGQSFRQVAVELGLKPKTAERQYYRARQKGLVA